MGQLTVHSFITLDGVMQAPGASDEDVEGDFRHGGWQMPFHDDESGAVIAGHYRAADALLLGRRTYEIFAPYWSTAPADNPFTAIMNETPKYVASRTLDHVGWRNSTLLEGDAATAIRGLKDRHAEIQVPGSGDLVQTLLREGLIDRMNLWLYPILLGTGKRLFAGGTVPATLRLAESRTFASGAVLLVYES